MKQTQPELLDLCRTSLQGALDWMKTSLENAERLQNQQLIAMRSALVSRKRGKTRPKRAEHALVVRAGPEHAVATRAAHEPLM
jgi:hypothetical protein